MNYDNPLAITDQAIDHQLSQLGTSIRFILDVTPTDAADVKESFLAGDVDEPTFTYRDLPTDPEVLHAILNSIDVGRVEDATVASLLRKKHRELGLQLTMLRVRDTPDFRPLSIELYGGVAPDLVTAAESIMARVAGGPSTADKLDADAFLALAEAEIDHYRELEPDIDIHAEIRHDVTGVMVSDDILLIGPESSVASDRAQALVQHEVGTHLVTQVNGSHQPLKVLATGLAGYDETQEGLAVLAEIACGELTGSRLRQLAARVLTVHRMLDGASFPGVFRRPRGGRRAPRGRVHDDDAHLSRRWPHQGRHLPARPARPARAPAARRGVPQPVRARQVRPRRPAPHRGAQCPRRTAHPRPDPPLVRRPRERRAPARGRLIR